MRISVCMIARNEEGRIGQALSSIPAHFEKVVVDTGSEDRTVEEARQHGAKVFFASWNDDFAEARNESMKYATGDYILILDADEKLEDGAEDQIRKFDLEHPGRAGTARIRNWSDGDWTQHRMIRLLPNRPEFRFFGAVHEQVYENGLPADILHSGVVIQHYGYDKEIYQTARKYERYQSLYKKSLKENPDNGYMWYQLGKLHYSQKEYAKAQEAFEEGIRLEQFSYYYYPPMLVQYGYTLKELGCSKQAYAFLQPFAEYYSNFPDLPFLLAILAMDIGDLSGIVPNYERALNIGETEIYSTVEGVGSYKAAYNMGVYYEIVGDRDKAIHYYERANQYSYAPATERLKKMLHE
ncbi:glycosyltransferase [Cohnella thermotolerans]|uniref:glycosyltransferase n=1 Tax=Cohnella thermotolerans TaxID=329858 RepID=UPI000478D52F|nr:glycosyltransferase [Cohnella thermotolerans]